MLTWLGVLAYLRNCLANQARRTIDSAAPGKSLRFAAYEAPQSTTQGAASDTTAAAPPAAAYQDSIQAQLPATAAANASTWTPETKPNDVDEPQLLLP